MLACLLMLCARQAMALPEDDGKKIFIARCASCHTVNRIMTGPALGGIDQRRDMAWIINFVHSSQSLVKKGDKDAVEVYEKFNRVIMPDHTDLTEADIRDIVAYIRSQEKNEAAAAPFEKLSRLQTPYQPVSLSRDYPLLIGYLLAVVLLMLGLLFVVRYTDLLRQRRPTPASPDQAVSGRNMAVLEHDQERA